MRVETTYRQLFIGGAWQDSLDDATTEVVNPADATPVGTVPTGSVADAGLAVEAARVAFADGPWPRMPARQRADHLQRFMDVLVDARDQLRRVITSEAGTLPAQVDAVHFGLGFAHLDFAVQAARQELATTTPLTVGPRPGGGRVLGGAAVLHQPIGVVGVITPFNFPFYLNVSKVGSALAAGNTVVLKPSPLTPLEGLLIGDAALEAGFPPGVVNIITGGPEVGEALVTDPRVDMISFTGSDTVGARIQELASATIKRVVLELGGKSPLIARADADVEVAAAAAFANITHHAGQGCALLTRHLVHRSLEDRFVERMVALAAEAVVGDPTEPATTMGPLISDRQRARVAGYVDDGVASGVELVAGGRPPSDAPGYYYLPTIFAGVDNKSRLAQEEIFGPVGVVITFDSDEEAVALANDSRFGLSGAIYSRDSGTAYEMARALRTGTVRINGGAATPDVHAPFAGWKRSGIGVEHGMAGILEYTLAKSISFNAG